MNKHKHQQGSHIIGIALAVVVVAVVGLIGWKVMSAQKSDKVSTQATNANKDDSAPPSRNDGIVMKSIGFNLDYYNQATNKAGDMEFTKTPLMFDQIWSDFGQQDPRSPNDPTKRNPQPTYVLPLGTKVLSMIDGVVTEVKELYSGDATVWVAPTKDSKLTFEHEHVSKPVVKIGDKVKSGQVIAEVSPHDSNNHPGFGILEIGILTQNNNRPRHLCPYEYLDASVKEDIGKKITALHEAWETYLGKDVYKQTFVTPGCVSLEPFDE